MNHRMRTRLWSRLPGHRWRYVIWPKRLRPSRGELVDYMVARAVPFKVTKTMRPKG